MTAYVLPRHDHLYIDGTWVAAQGDTRLPVIDPVTEALWFDYPESTPAEVDHAIAAARRAFDSGPWPRMAPAARAACLRRIADALEPRLEQIAQSWTRQMGAPIGLTRKLVPQNVQLFRYYADLIESFPFAETRLRPNGGETLVVQQPVGVCAAIAPWNAPLVLLSYKIAAGLAAGCTFVAKPSPETPLDAIILAEAIDAAGLPEGVFNLVFAGREIGEALVRSPAIDKVAFTGSTAAGQKIAAICGERLAKTSLELGGKSAALLLEDADFAAALPSLLVYSMPISGQVCFSLTRILVPESRAAEFTAMFVKALSGLVMGDPLDPQTHLGPLAFARQMERVLSYIAIAKDEGAQLLCGGHRLDRTGYFVAPTVFADVTPAMTIARDEIFGPVLAIMTYRDTEDAIAIANATPFGLSGAVYGADTARAIAVAKRIRTGHVTVNGNVVDVTMPFGGVKQSGSGREGGIEGLTGYLDPQTINLA